MMAVMRVAKFGQVMRRNVGGHADGNTHRAVQQQIGQFGRQDRRFLFRAVKVGHEINRIFFDIEQHLFGDGRQLGFGITHRQRRRRRPWNRSCPGP